MTTHCPTCSRPIRWDDPLRRVEENGGQFHKCRACLGEPDPRYEKGQRTPKLPHRPGMNIPVCGLCRRARYKNDGNEDGTGPRFIPNEADVGASELGMHVLKCICAQCRGAFMARRSGDVEHADAYWKEHIEPTVGPYYGSAEPILQGSA